jgi:NAD(P)-dependent dehydrogenase (short-subunit alcohol dehydrogenase family)
VALAFAEAGAAVTVAARSLDQVQETADQIASAGGRALALAVDVADRGAVEGMVAATERQLGPVDVLVNNAGVLGPLGPLWETDPDEWQRGIDVNLVGPYLCCRAVLPGMVARGHGRIINVSSFAGGRGYPYSSAYNTSKTALVRLAEALALETREHGISVFAINPGGVRTTMSNDVFDDDEKDKWLGFRALPEAIWVPADRPAQLCVVLAAGKADRLSGRFFGGYDQDEIDDLIRRADEVQQQDLYTLRRQTLVPVE